MASEAYLNHFLHPRGQGLLATATHRAQAEDPVCGDRMELDLEVREGVILEACYRVQGCAGSIAAGSALCGLLTGRQAQLPPDLRGELEAALGGVPAGKGHAVDLAARLARLALVGRGPGDYP